MEKGEMRYPHIFSTGKIGNLKVQNRIKYAATETNFNRADGFVTDKEVGYMEAQAKGGAGIVTTQGAYPDEKGEGKGFRGMMSIAHDRYIPGLSRIANVIKANGAISCLQILHCGREGGVDLDYCLMPSVVPQRLSYFKTPREMTKEEIERAIKDHIEAARRAVTAGFDMIELSGIVGYLISTFLSSYTNKRKDEYGGNIRQRARLMVEIIEGVKAEVRSIPVGIRLCGLELLDDRGGNSMEESIETFKIAEEAGADYVSVTVGWHESSQSVITRDVPMGHWLYVAEEVKRAVSIPVMMAFRQFIPEIPEKAIAEGKIDFWEACRPMIADPELPKKAKEAREEEIIPCIACNICFSRLYYHQPIMCTVRPSLGHETERKWGYYGFDKAEKEKEIVVIGGGPSGLQFASVAAKRGHKVTLYERLETLGGNIRLASKVDKGAVELMRPIRYLEGECRRSGVEIRLGVDCSTELLRYGKVDAIVLATGSIPGGDSFLDRGALLTPEEVMIEGVSPGRDVVIIGGDGVGLGVAVFLLSKGSYNIMIIEESSRPGRDVSPFYLWQYMQSFKKKGIVILKRAKVVDCKGNRLIVSTPDGTKDVGFDTVINAKRQSRETDMVLFKEIARETYLIGDAKRPRRLHNAIHDGYRLGMVI